MARACRLQHLLASASIHLLCRYFHLKQKLRFCLVKIMKIYHHVGMVREKISFSASSITHSNVKFYEQNL